MKLSRRPDAVLVMTPPVDVIESVKESSAENVITEALHLK
jgi:hypothetical protein